MLAQRLINCQLINQERRTLAGLKQAKTRTCTERRARVDHSTVRGRG